jgi:Ca-activated chloride channel family protein
VYPQELPDLFTGSQLVIMGRFDGKGASAVKLTGKVGKEEREFVYELGFPDKTDDGREFVEQLWARRKVGYLLDQVRLNGEKKELKDEVIALARKYGITTPYTSYLIVPDGPVLASAGGRINYAPTFRMGGGMTPPGLGGGPGGGGAAGSSGRPAAAPKPVLDFARKPADDRAKERGAMADKELKKNVADEARAKEGEGKDKGKAGPKSAGKGEAKPGSSTSASREALDKKDAYEKARELLARRDKDGKDGVTTGKLGVDLSLQVNNLRNLTNMERSAIRNVAGRNCLEVGGVWIDEGFTAKTKAVVVKAHSDAYFKLLEKQPHLKKVFGLGNHLVWVAPSGTALVIDASHGKDKITDAEITELFAAKK